MKKLLLVFALISLFSCGNDEEVKPMNSNTATLSIKTTNDKYSVTVAYMTKDKWGQEEPYIVEKIVHGGDTTLTINIDREQNFGYFIQRQGTNPKVQVEATLKYKDHNSTKTFLADGGMLWDIYEFYKQVF